MTSHDKEKLRKIAVRAIVASVVPGWLLFVGVAYNPSRNACEYEELYRRIATFPSATLARMSPIRTDLRALPSHYRLHRRLFGWTDHFKQPPGQQRPVRKDPEISQLCLFNSDGALFSVQIVIQDKRAIAVDVYVQAGGKEWEKAQEWLARFRQEFPRLPVQLMQIPVDAVTYYEMLKAG